MGAIAEGIVAYGQPLIDQTDGSQEQLDKAFALITVCFNLALTPEAQRDAMIKELQPSFKMDDAEFAKLRSSVIMPMIRRHEDMFPLMHRRASPDFLESIPTVSAPSRKTPPVEAYPGTDRYAPCPCNSGQKYKFCCGSKSR